MNPDFATNNSSNQFLRHTTTTSLQDLQRQQSQPPPHHNFVQPNAPSVQNFGQVMQPTPQRHSLLFPGSAARENREHFRQNLEQTHGYTGATATTSRVFPRYRSTMPTMQNERESLVEINWPPREILSDGPGFLPLNGDQSQYIEARDIFSGFAPGEFN